MRKSKKKVFTKDEIAMLSANPNVKHCRENRLTFTYEFRLKLYEEWVKEVIHRYWMKRSVMIQDWLDC